MVRQHLINVADLHIKGAHNAANALAATGALPCDWFGVCAVTECCLYNFKGLTAPRSSGLHNIDDVDYFNDSKGTNVGATCAALSGLPQKVVLIAGGEGKGQDFGPLVSPVSQVMDVLWC